MMMKRIINTLLCSIFVLPVLSCQQELIFDVPVNESIVLDLSSGLTKAAHTDVESYVEHLDIFIFESDNNGKPAALATHETVVVNNQKEIVLEAKRSDFVAGDAYLVYLLANSTADFSGIENFSQLNQMKQEDMNLHLTGLDVSGAPQYFLMDAVAKDSDGNSLVVLNDGVPENNTMLNALLARAAAKVVINIAASERITFVDYGISQGSEGGLFYVRNMPYETWVLAETQKAVNLQNVKLRTTVKTDTEYFTWNPGFESGSKKVSLTTYVYPHHWNDESILEKETCAVINLPMDYKVSDSETVAYHNSWYKIPMTDDATFERNNIYVIDILLDRPGASEESEPITLDALSFSITDWTEVTVDVGNETRPSYLQLNTDHVDMYNVNTDDSSLEFASSSPIKSIVLDRAYFINRMGKEVTVNQGIKATADAGLNGGITIFSPFVKEAGVVNQDSHNNVIRYMTFTVTNEDGLTAQFTVHQYPTIYITHEVGHYSYRDDFGGTTYMQMGNPNYSGASWNNNSKTWTYTQNASNSNFFGSKVSNSYRIVNGKPVLQQPASTSYNESGYSIYYAYWERPRSGGNYVMNDDSNVSVFNNPRMYHIHVTATSNEYIVARPRMEDGYTESTTDNTMLVSPSFMIASQLGGTDLGSQNNSVSVEKAKQHCAQYVEVTYDEAGNPVIYDDWRLPTAAEIEIIISHQYDSQAMVEVLNGGQYYCAINPAATGSGDQKYLKNIPNNNLTSNHVRCIRDAY